MTLEIFLAIGICAIIAYAAGLTHRQVLRDKYCKHKKTQQEIRHQCIDCGAYIEGLKEENS